MQKREYVLVEKVSSNKKGNIFYSLPDVIENASDVRSLIDVIDNNNELKLMAIGDISDEMYEHADATDMWDILDKTAIGVKLLNLYPKIRNYRISSVLMSRKPELYKYDYFANRKLSSKKETKIPSFKEYISNPDIYNPHEVVGVRFK
jgi:hypothetical protein